MDYTEFPRELIYKEKASLKDFGVSNEMTIEHRFYEGLLKRPSIKGCFKKRETILRIFNNAYYLCTLILMDEDPRLSIDSYREIAENTERTIDWVNHFAPMTMALVYLELKGCRQECACELRIFDEFLLDDIYEHYRDWDTKGATEGKADFYELAGNGEQQYQKLPSDLPSFPPRTITIKSLGEAFDNDGYRHSLRYFTYDYDMERIAEIFRYLGRTKEEKEALRDELKLDIECFCDEGRKHRFLAQLDGMDFSSEEHAVEQGMEARYSRALLEISILENKVHQLNKEISQLKLNAQTAEDMLPSSEYHENLRNELNSAQEDLNSLKNTLKLFNEQELSSNEFIILFSNLFGIDLSPESINQSAFAKFLQELSGKKGISQSTISRLKDKEKNRKFTPKMKSDAVHLVKLLMEIPRNVANKKAEVLYKLIEDIVKVYDLKWATDFKDMSAEKKDQFREFFDALAR
jgi:hypothetical protein